MLNCETLDVNVSVYVGYEVECQLRLLDIKVIICTNVFLI